MRFLLAIALGLVISAPAPSPASDSVQAAAQARAQPYQYSKRLGLEIRVVGDGWGNARPEDIETVLYSVAAILLEHFPGRRLYPILVTHASDRPITLFGRGPKNEYRMRLAAKDRHWARYAYEFAHELVH